ncbi:hypothetical protein J2R98_000841 [Alkalibacillus filiformis]|uniref:DUF2624 domain-containing protein n=1 Tax=Alkalibacillus filiformis TaxID=200990 RepID=A0ABU0DRF5_9BACI|nr:DUF2624 family protein [Alkalibacillus filiformis]MDQ0351038.1 hypothetical protein [Alkalibacillus filiformis]
MLKQIITTRLYHSTPEEVVKYSQEYGIPVTHEQAAMILSFIKKEKIDPFSEKDRLRTFRFIQQNIGTAEAKQAYQLLYQLAKQYQLDELL